MKHCFPRIQVLFILLVAGTYSLWAMGEPEPRPEPEIREVTMFTNGTSLVTVESEVTGSGILEVPVQQEELLDILKTLVVRDLDGGRILSAGFPASEPLQRSLSRLALDLSGNPGMEEMLRRAAGEEVTVHTRTGKVRGEILSVEAASSGSSVGNRPGGDSPLRTVVNLNGSRGLRRVDISSINRLEFHSAAIENDLETAARQLRTSSDNSGKTLRIAHEGEGSRRIQLTYLRPAPRWKSSYRLVVDNHESSGGEATLEGWSIVDNTGSRDWNNIQLNLSTANPVSFVMDLYSARYIDRPELSLPGNAAAEPPNERAMKQEMFASAPAMSESAIMDSRSAADRFSGSSVEPGAMATDRGSLGTLVEYEITRPVSVLSGSSAMVPILSETLAVDSYLSYTGGQNQSVYRAVEFELPQNLQLVSGPLALYDGDGFAGEALLPYTSGGESQSVEYALEQGLVVSEERSSGDGIIRTIIISDGYLRSELLQTRTTDYHISAETEIGTPLVIRHPVNSGWTLQSGTVISGPEEDEQNLEPSTRDEAQTRSFRLEPAQLNNSSLSTLRIREEQLISRRYELNSARQDLFLQLLSSSALSSEQRSVLNRLLEFRSTIDSLNDEARLLRNRRQRIYDEQQRISRNMENLDRESEIYRRYLEDLNDQEDNLVQIRRDLDRIDREIQQKRNQLENFISNIQL
ncbi:DUF4139 domain-containing protein [Salinispira pacifica]|uniref:DUF4139 domain-containing protein n=1 Tax=Salinispira pacifica TaxID=1307761 RepID=V5WKM5_9SPIO|nr:DUF4139 domain-containing protein [Salinispira pacifica]AHC16195.1 hypothetical protein L21SP2_2847 [Salinispira pacifica]